MLKAVELLVTGEKRQVGNHYRELRGAYKLFFYHRTCICRVDTNRNLCFISNGGYTTSSTTRAINSYINYFSNKGYKIVDTRKIKHPTGRCVDLNFDLDFSGYVHYLTEEGKL